MRKSLLGLLSIAMMITTASVSQPVITSFSPAQAKPGDAVTIAGTGFNTNASKSVVYFGATQAAVTGATCFERAINFIIPDR